MRSRHVIIAGVLMTAAASAPLRGQNIPAAFADIGYGARAMGMGGAHVALASDAYGLFWNPAGLAYVRGWQVGTMYARQFNIIPYGLVSGAKVFGDRYGTGLGFLSSGDDAWRESTFLVSGAMKFAPNSGFSFGMTVKIRTVSFGGNSDDSPYHVSGSAAGVGMDLGLRWKFAPRWTLGAVYRDILNQLSYTNKSRNTSYNEALPGTTVLGTAFMARKNLVFVMDWQHIVESVVPDRIAAGFEWRIFTLLYLRGGWSQNLTADPNRMLNGGAGLQYFSKSFGIQFDVAYQSHFLADTPRVSTTIWF
ncbi:hypothetical protein JXO52_11275 [bacterium]|nr:hypothetical protein [bacterium]